MLTGEKESRRMNDRADYPSPRTLRERISDLSPHQQLGYGCVGVIIAGTLALYCGGMASLIARPFFLERAGASEELSQTPQQPIILPTLLPTLPAATPFSPPQPNATLPPTPTQAPIPTRDRTAAAAEISGTPAVTTTVSAGTPRATQSPTATATATRR